MGEGPVRVSWEVDDGYVGKSRPQHTFIDRDDWEECKDSPAARDALIDAYVQEDFFQKISWSVTSIDE